MEDFYEEIVQWLEEGQTNKFIIQHLATLGLNTSVRSLQRFMVENELERKSIKHTSAIWLDKARHLVSCNITASQICQILANEYSISISESSLRNELHEHGIHWRSNLSDNQVEELVRANNTGLLGCRMLTSRLRIITGENISRDKVSEALRVVDPEGVIARTKRRLHRRTYDVPGANYMWHLDGYDKLSRYGFPIHGCTDGFSRKFIWLNVVENNRLQQTVLALYRDAVVAAGGLPTITRSDGGTENLAVGTFQITAYGPGAHIYGSSTRNTRIEGAWRQLRDRSMDEWMLFFETLLTERLYDINDRYQVRVAKFVFKGLITQDLELYCQTWNSHRIRREGNYGSEGGVPHVLYHHSGSNYLKPMPEGFLIALDSNLMSATEVDYFDGIQACQFLASLGIVVITKQNMKYAFIRLVNHLPRFILQ